MTLKNQIGLDGDVTPLNFMAATNKFEVYKGDADLFNVGFLKIQRRLSRRYAENEYHVTLKLPVRRRKFYSFVADGLGTGKPAMLVVFGRVRLAGAGFHARGGIIHVNPVFPTYVTPEPFGHKNPINLANYK